MRYGIGIVVLVLAASGCSGDDGGNTNEQEQEQALTPCFEWQHFMRHAGHDMTEVTALGDGEYVFSKVGFLHGGSWELNFQAMAGDTMDLFQVLLCVEGSIPFAQCWDDDPANDENCETAIDARCTGDEDVAGSVVHGMHGNLMAEFVSVDPDPPSDTMMATVTVRLTDTSGAAVADAAITHGECSGQGGADGHAMNEHGG